MDAANPGQIFEPLNHGAVSEGVNNAGLGLGLYIANEVARAHGGEIVAAGKFLNRRAEQGGSRGIDSHGNCR
jgi:signal transduction histidine kinase